MLEPGRKRKRGKGRERERGRKRKRGKGRERERHRKRKRGRRGGDEGMSGGKRKQLALVGIFLVVGWGVEGSDWWWIVVIIAESR